MSVLLLIPWIVLPQASQPSDADLDKAFQQSIAADKAAKDAAQPQAAQPAATPPPSSGALLNPEISVIGAFAATARRNGDVDPSFRAGDDPPAQGISVQELELSFAADVDPYFKMRAFLTMSDTQSIEIEEAYLLTTALPRGLQIKAGAFRSSFGRNNELHLHVNDFPRRPKITQLLGEDGLRGPAVQVSYLLPLPWYATVLVEYIGLSQDPSATAELEQFFSLSDTWSLLWGLSSATLQRGAPDAMPLAIPDREYLLGTDVYLKWKPTNEVSTYWWVAFTGEYVMSRTSNKDWDGAAYAQVVAQVARRWRVGVRGDLVGFPRVGLGREIDASVEVSFLPSEFSRVRLAFAHDENLDDSSKSNDYLMFTLEGTIGAHGAHPF